MDEQIKTIFRDAGADDNDLQRIEQLVEGACMNVRELVIEISNMCPKPELVLAIRMLICRAIALDMENARERYRTQISDAGNANRPAD